MDRVDWSEYQDEPEGEDCCRSQWVDPEDRLWRHPTELSFLACRTRSGQAGPTARRAHRHPVWAAFATAGFAGAALAAAAYATSSVFLGGPPPRGLSARLASVGTGTTVTEVSAESAIGAGGTRALWGPNSVGTGSSVGHTVVTVHVATATGEKTGTALELGTPGLFLTAYRLVASGTVAVSLGSGNPAEPGNALSAKLVGADPATGIAVLRTSVSPTRGGVSPVDPGLAIDPAGTPQPGEHLLLVGSPAGNGGRAPATAGAIVVHPWVNMIAPDGSSILGASEVAPSAPTSLGSALVGPDGSVVGIVTYYNGCNGTGGPAGIGIPTNVLATPIGAAEEAAEAITSEIPPAHGWLGVDVHQMITPDGLPGGVVVDNLEYPSPAATNGILPGDVIVSVDGQPIESVLDLEADISLREPGTPVVVAAERSGNLVSLMVPLGSATPGPGFTQ